MSYQALYRKWRPGEFDEVKGQEHIVTTLKNQIDADRIGHAYLFCGTRGTGKTTVAKLFAKTVNCEHPVNGSPCNECASCKAINAGASMNVIEIDAASNNGVDNIRDIRDSVQYSPTTGKYKVYIIDEVHMLSIGAFNALLKTLEEPPAYVIFILATTEAHKIPVTILSRCQRYDFKRISIDVIANRLMDLMERENIEVEEKAIRYVAKAADGSMRDGLSLLDQCIAFYLGEKLTYEHVLEVLGAVDMDVLSTLYMTIVNNDVSAMLNHIEKLVMDGREMMQLVNDFTWYLRNLMLVKESPDLEDVLEVSKEQLEGLQKAAELCDSESLMRYIRICSELSNRLRYSSQKRIDVEVSFVKLCRPQMERNTDSLLERLRMLEQKVEELTVNGVTVAASTGGSSDKESPRQNAVSYNLEEELSKRYEPADIKDLKKLCEHWIDILNILRDANYNVLVSALSSCKVTVGKDGKLLNLAFAEELQKEILLSNPADVEFLKKAMSKYCERDVDFEIILIPKAKANDFEYADIRKLVTIPISEE